MKLCIRCNVEQDTANFYKDNSKKDLLNIYCKECHRKRNKDNRDKQNEYWREYRKANLEKRRETGRDYYHRNKEKASAYKKEYRKANRAKHSEHENKRRALKAGGNHEKYTTQEMLDKYGTLCYICGIEIDLTAPRKVGVDGWETGLHIEHVINIALGGDDTLENVRPSHGLCNLTKKPKGE